MAGRLRPQPVGRVQARSDDRSAAHEMHALSLLPRPARHCIASGVRGVSGNESARGEIPAGRGSEEEVRRRGRAVGDAEVITFLMNQGLAALANLTISLSLS